MRGGQAGHYQATTGTLLNSRDPAFPPPGIRHKAEIEPEIGSKSEEVRRMKAQQAISRSPRLKRKKS
jgi:hypothetical protein